MAFTQIELKRVAQTVGELCLKRSPMHLRDKVRLEYAVKGHDVVIYERRPRWNNPQECIGWGQALTLLSGSRAGRARGEKVVMSECKS